MKKKVTLIVIAALLIISLIVGISYAYWRITYTQTTSNKIATSCFSMELSNEKNDITLDSAYPISDEKGKSLTPYYFTITNTCDLFASYTINLEMLEGTTLNSKYIKTMINNEAITNLNTLETTDTSIDGATESRVLFKGALGSGDSTDYTFRLWMDSETPAIDDAMNKVFQAKITIIAEVSNYSPVANGFTNLADALLVNEYQTTNVDVAKNKINSKQSVDFSKTAPIINWTEQVMPSKTNVVITKAAPTTIGSFGIEENATKILMGSSYNFNPKTGLYTLVNTQYLDVNEVDFTNQEYYMCNSTISLSTNNTVSYWDGTTCAFVHRVVNVLNVNQEQWKFSSGDLVDVIKYTFQVITRTCYENESDKSDKGLYKAIDDYGDAYYYRGNVKNNNITFAGFNWQILRINGDGSVRLLYNGIDKNSLGADKTIGTYKYNTTRNDMTYVGYMYSGNVPSTTDSVFDNDKDSNIKTVLDNWYKANIYDKGYSSYIADSGFCNDRSLAESGKFNSSDRVYDFSPMLICENKANDLFTTTSNTLGNQKLIYPIGTITVDELMMSGMVKGYVNNLVYTWIDVPYWTMSPILYSITNTMARNWITSVSGNLDYGTVTDKEYIRPVINLKADTEIISGIGTTNNPFIVK